MLEVTLLGTGGMVPLPGRFLTSLMVRHNGRAILIDCGEGTQVAIRCAGLGFKQIDVICLTHFHADHIAGLPGLLLTIGNSGKTTPLTIIGPKYARKIVECLCAIAPQLPYQLEFIELEAGGACVELWDFLTLGSHPVEHWISCYAYRIDLKRPGRFNAEKAKALDIPVRYWSVLQSGKSVELDSRTVNSADVMGSPRKGISVCYATDLRPSDSLARFAAGSDLFICEGMYGDTGLREKAIEHRHCLFEEAANMALKAKANELWLTHFSPSMPEPAEYLHVAADIFSNTWIDKKSEVLRFSNE